MKPRVHRHLCRKVRWLEEDYQQLDPGDGDYEEARSRALVEIGMVMKHEMRADTYTRRGDRDGAARSWWLFRASLRKAHTLIQCARVFRAFPQRKVAS